MAGEWLELTGHLCSLTTMTTSEAMVEQVCMHQATLEETLNISYYYIVEFPKK